MDVLSDNSIPLSLRMQAADASLELTNATFGYYKDMHDRRAFDRYLAAKSNYDKILRDLALFYPD